MLQETHADDALGLFSQTLRKFGPLLVRCVSWALAIRRADLPDLRTRFFHLVRDF